MKIDISKAFDTLSWEFIIQFLIRRGFGRRWCSWICGLLRTASSSVLVNGETCEPFPLGCGVRQGDPLSPALFILAMDTLQAVLLWAVQNKLLSDLSLPPSIPRASFFADDAIIFFRPCSRDMEVISAILRLFGEATGLRINMQKTTVTCIRSDDSISASVAQHFSCQLKHFPLQYLGLPLSIFRLRRQDILPLIDKHSCKMKGWKPKLLAPAGRLTLTQSVLMALPIHFLTVLPLPAWALKIVNRRCRGFIWKGDSDISGGYCLLPWARVCMPKACGGLGVLNLKWFGYALRCRWPCSRWDAELRPWHQLPEAQEKEVSSIFKAATSICLGDGQRAKFWTDKWLPGGCSIEDLAPALFSFVKDSGRSVKEALCNRNWIKDITGGISVQAMAQYLRIWDIIQSVSLSVGVPDCLVWKWTADHKFSVSSVYSMFFATNVRFACHKPIWRSKAPPRCKFFMWLAIHRRCLTADNLERRGWPSNGNCPLCLSTHEDCTHLFVHCAYTQQVWMKFREWTRADFRIPDDSFVSIEDWWLSARKEVPKNERRNFDTIIILLHWRIWKERNARIFEQVACNIDRVLDLIREDIRAWRAAGCVSDLF